MNELTQLGVGAIFVIVVLRTVFDFLGKNKNGKMKGEECIPSEEFREFAKGAQTKETCGEIVKRMDSRFDDIHSTLSDIKRLIISNGNK